MITRKDVFKEVISPKEITDTTKINVLIYSAIYMAIRLLLDVRSNQVKIASKLGLELSNKDEKGETPNEIA